MKTLGDFLRRVVAGGAWTDDEIADVYELADRLDSDGKDTPDEPEPQQFGFPDSKVVYVPPREPGQEVTYTTTGAAPLVDGSTEQSGTPDAPPES